MVKVNIEFDLKDDTEEQIQKLITKIYKNNTNTQTGQQRINTDNNEEKKVLCNKCQRDLYNLYDSEEVKKIINYCNIKYKDKTYCRDCQEKLSGGGA